MFLLMSQYNECEWNLYPLLFIDKEIAPNSNSFIKVAQFFLFVFFNLSEQNL